MWLDCSIFSIIFLALSKLSAVRSLTLLLMLLDIIICSINVIRHNYLSVITTVDCQAHSTHVWSISKYINCLLLSDFKLKIMAYFFQFILLLDILQMSLAVCKSKLIVCISLSSHLISFACWLSRYLSFCLHHHQFYVGPYT